MSTRRWLLRGWGCQNVQLSVAYCEFNRTVASEFAVEFDRHILLARDANLPGLEIFDFRQTNLRAEGDVLEVFDNLEVTELFERDDIEQAVIIGGVFEKRKRPAVMTAVPNQDE